MELGAFSVSLAVRDIAASLAFYEKLGFAKVGGDQAQNWLILRNGTTTLGLFQGMFDKNVLTFNPGWDANAQPLSSTSDQRGRPGVLAGAAATPARLLRPCRLRRAGVWSGAPCPACAGRG